jgi:hypothetical protein
MTSEMMSATKASDAARAVIVEAVLHARRAGLTKGTTFDSS